MFLPALRLALAKAEAAYGPAVQRDLAKAIDRAKNRQGWLERCMQAMAMDIPKALLWQKIRALGRVLPATSFLPDSPSTSSPNKRA